MALSREQVKKAKGRLKQEKVFIPEWAEDGESVEEAFVIVRGLKATETIQIGALVEQGYAEVAVIMHFCVLDENGEKLFPTLDDAQDLFENSALAPVERLSDSVYELSGLTARRQKAIEKKSETMKTSNSG
ncbi:MAG TPA: hypothetical protein VGN57_12700 [Pirellulaceae bacterium]|jgi:hypothetical protein|nr:hypothetical protein [Pirellulaceae bacterium]